MASFRDRKGSFWAIEFDGPLIGRIRQRWKEVDFGRRPHDALQALADDPVLFDEVLYAICEREAQSANVSREEFARRVTGQAVDDATEALLEALEDFSPPRQARQVQALRRMSETAARAQQVGADRLLARADQLDQMLEQSIQTKIDEALDRVMKTATAPPSMPSPPATPSPDRSLFDLSDLPSGGS